MSADLYVLLTPEEQTQLSVSETRDIDAHYTQLAAIVSERLPTVGSCVIDYDGSRLVRIGSPGE